MATTETTPLPEQEHTKKKVVGVAKPSSKLQQALHQDNAKEEDVTVPKIKSARQPSVPPIHGKKAHEEKEEPSSTDEKDLIIRSNATNRGKHAYEHTIVGEQTEAGPYGSAPVIFNDKQHAAAGPRYLHVGDHVVVCSRHESEHTYGYREAAEVRGSEQDDCSHYYKNPEDWYGYKLPEVVYNDENTCPNDYDKPENVYGHKVPEEVSKEFKEEYCPNDYDKPETVYGHKVPEEVSKAFEEESCSNDYDKPEDVDRHKDSKEVSFAYRATERAVEMWSRWKSSKVCWLAMGCGLLVATSVVVAGILATQITSDGRVAFGSKLKQNGTMILETSTPWKTTLYEENNSAFDEFIVFESTPTYLPFTNSSVTTDTLPRTATFLLTDDLNECAKKPCKHGTCQDRDGGYKCTCSPGWTGQNCNQHSECFKKPCQHGRCVYKPDGYKCTCSKGWTGKNCQQGELLSYLI
ncbi:uncharacterized protein LOC144866393 [Branchiostoma floridae x Branchiostoma japonicum]